MSVNTKPLSRALSQMQDQTIGLFCMTKYSSEYNPVIENTEGNLVVVSVGTLLGLSTTYIHMSEGRYIEFPEGKSLSDMINGPIEFAEWYKENIEMHK